MLSTPNPASMHLPRLPVLLAALLAGSCVTSSAWTAGWSTDFNAPDSADAFEWAETHPTVAPARWELAEDAAAPSPPGILALAHTENEGPTFNLALAREPRFEDLELSLWVCARTGETDQGGGPVWRAQDADNYYVCRFNPLESNFRLYVVAGGQRRQLATADVPTKPGEWHHVEVRMEGSSIRCTLDGGAVLEARDDTLRGAGRVGMWTKADAATRFDDLAVIALSED